jgi:uncharacterized protein (PEP-CTERM system associated)
VNLLGDLNFFDKVFHIEGAVNVSQQFFTPFGAQPVDLANSTANRYRSTTYRLSPYAQGKFGEGIEYELRNNNIWANLGNSPVETSNSRTTELVASAGTTGDRRIGWNLYYDYADTTFTSQQSSIVTQLGRVSPYYGISPQLRITSSVG